MNNISLLIGAILSSNIYKCNEEGIVEVHIGTPEQKNVNSDFHLKMFVIAYLYMFQNIT